LNYINCRLSSESRICHEYDIVSRCVIVSMIFCGVMAWFILWKNNGQINTVLWDPDRPTMKLKTLLIYSYELT